MGTSENTKLRNSPSIDIKARLAVGQRGAEEALWGIAGDTCRNCTLGVAKTFCHAVINYSLKNLKNCVDTNLKMTAFQ